MRETTEETYHQITGRLIRDGRTITTMESCTAGLVASLLTDTEGSSAILKGAFVTYCNEAKVQQGVPAETIARYGVYSAEIALAMASACRTAYRADIGVGITGTLGNVDPENADSVPGEVFFAIVTEQVQRSFHEQVPAQGSRGDQKMAVAALVAAQLLALLREMK